LLRGARQLLTLRGPRGYRSGAALHDLALIDDGAVLIRDGRIDEVGPSRRLENLADARGAVEIPAHGRLVLPGFVDQGLSLFVPEVKRRTYLQARADAVATLRACLQHGTTSAEVDAGGDAITSSDLPWIRQAIKMPHHGDVLLGWRLLMGSSQSAESEKAQLARLMAMVARRPEVRTITLEVQPDCAVEAVTGVVEEARSLEFSVKLAGEPDIAGPVLRASRRSGCLSFTGHSAPHAEQLDVMAELGYPAVLRPQSDLMSGGGTRVNLRRFLEKQGIPVLATGYHRLRNPGFSMQAVIALAVLGHRMSIEEAIVAATINAACSLRCDVDRGSLEVGKRADLLVLDVPDYRELPRQLGVNHVAMVIRRGTVVFNRTSWRGPATAATATPSPNDRVCPELFRRP
jgi:imidazolonepropionase